MLGQGDYQRAFEKLTPKAERDLSKAQRYATEGAVSKKGDLISETSGLDALKQAIGFGASDVSYAYDQRNKIRVPQKRLEKRRSALMNQYARAIMDGRGNAADIWEDIMPFNKVNPRITITRKKLATFIKRRQTNRNKKKPTHGLYISDKYKQQLEDKGYHF